MFVTIGRPLLRLETVTSTMDVARTLLVEGAPAGMTVLAGYQSAGRGRSGRVWEASPWSSILMSFLTASRRPPGELGLLSLCWGVAVAETVETFIDAPARIKWPNDVQVAGQKISGILVQNIPWRGTHWQVTGVGLNIRGSRNSLPERATSLAQLRGDLPVLNEVLSVLLVRLNTAFAAFEQRDHDLVERLVLPRLAMRGEAVSVADGGRQTAGTLTGLEPDGALLLTDAAGQVRRIVAGELTRGPRLA